MNPKLIEYRRRMVEAALARSPEPVSAGDLLDMVGSLALAEGHDVLLVRGVTTKVVAAIVRQLAADGRAKAAGERRNSTRGRPDPLWLPIMPAASKEIPDEPDEDDQGPLPRHYEQPPAQPGIEYTPEQIRVLLDVQDAMCSAVSEFLMVMKRHTKDARQRLTEVGL